MSHVTKLLHRVIMARIRNKIHSEIGAEQFGFKKGVKVPEMLVL